MVDMGWDQSRVVPWQRLIREWLIYVAVMAAILLLFFRDAGAIGALAGLLVSGPLYLAFGYVLAKFGYTRRTLKDLREANDDTPTKKRRKKSDPDDSGDAGDSATAARARPAPTRRTSGGGNRPKSKPRRR